jgi:hypothetical protein
MELVLMKAWLEYKRGEKKDAKSDLKKVKKNAPKNSGAKRLAIQFLELL